MTASGVAALHRALGAAASGLAGVEQVEGAEGLELRRGGATFAVLTPAGADFRLDRAVATAASRTPDTGPTARGAEWVAFTPPTADESALDRAVAWLELAWRRAAPAD